MPSNLSDKPSYAKYTEWYEEWFHDDLSGGAAEQWYDQVTEIGIRRFEKSDFWRSLQKHFRLWETSFMAEHESYPLFGATQQPTEINKKSFESVLNKSYRWNVLNNDDWPDPPRKAPSTAPTTDKSDPYDSRLWFGPHNWLSDFPDIFRVRLTTTYFDGVGFLAERVRELAERTTSRPPCLRLLASRDGYHAAHVWTCQPLDMLDYENRDFVPVPVRLEIQVTTAIQDTISQMLHGVYEDWRLNGAPDNWEWDHESSGFAVNYLGSTLHYLEGMIVVARDRGRTS